MLQNVELAKDRKETNRKYKIQNYIDKIHLERDE